MQWSRAFSLVWSDLNWIENWSCVGCGCQLGCLSLYVGCSRWLPPHGTPKRHVASCLGFVRSSKPSSYGRSAKLFGISNWRCLFMIVPSHSLGPLGCYLVSIFGVSRIPRRGEKHHPLNKNRHFQGGEMAAPGLLSLLLAGHWGEASNGKAKMFVFPSTFDGFAIHPT